jgi:anti-sigma regulatory factor (Ser/Thr protein kinase)
MLQMAFTMRIKIDTNSLIRLEQIVQQICSSNPIAEELTPVEYDLNELLSITPAVSVPLVARIRYLRQHPLAGKVSIALMRHAHCARYLSRVDFFKHSGQLEQGGLFRRFYPGRFLPITLIQSEEDYDKAAEHLSDVIADEARLQDKANRDGLYIILNELLGNVFHHAEPTQPAVVAGQVYQNSRRPFIEIVIADTGIGLRRSLSARKEFRNRLRRESAVELATEVGVTSKTEKHSGYGLWIGKEFVKLNGGTFKLISGTESLTGAGPYDSVSPRLKRDWQGTIVGMRLWLDGPLAIGPVYRNLDKLRPLDL